MNTARKLNWEPNLWACGVALAGGLVIGMRSRRELSTDRLPIQNGPFEKTFEEKIMPEEPEDKVDRALWESFPASDPPSY
jgi:hypothetical protein